MVAVALQPAQATRPAPASAVAVQLGDPVDECAEQVGARMLAAVPAHVAGRVAQPEVGAESRRSGARARETRRCGPSTAREAGRETARRRARARTRRRTSAASPREDSDARCARTCRPAAPTSPGAVARRDGTEAAAATHRRCSRTLRQSRPGSRRALSRALHHAVRIHRLVPVPSVNGDASPSDNFAVVAGTSKALNSTPFRSCGVEAGADSLRRDAESIIHILYWIYKTIMS